MIFIHFMWYFLQDPNEVTLGNMFKMFADNFGYIVWMIILFLVAAFADHLYLLSISESKNYGEETL